MSFRDTAYTDTSRLIAHIAAVTYCTTLVGRIYRYISISTRGDASRNLCDVPFQAAILIGITALVVHGRGRRPRAEAAATEVCILSAAFYRITVVNPIQRSILHINSHSLMSSCHKMNLIITSLQSTVVSQTPSACMYSHTLKSGGRVVGSLRR